MTHKLLIELELSPEEVIQNQNFIIRFHITNINEKRFPGGKFDRLQVRFYGLGQVMSSADVTELSSIPELPVNATYTYQREYFGITDGLAWVYIDIKSNEEDVLLYQSRDSSVTRKPWQRPFYIRNRDYHQIILLLQEISRKIDSFNQGDNNG